jgi:two-component system LytT family sensor kinase
MAVVLGMLLGVVLAASVVAAWRLAVAPRRVLSPERETMRRALHHATATLPHLRRGLDAGSAGKAAAHLRVLTQAAAVAVTDGERVLALDGARGADTSQERLLELAGRVRDGRVYVEPRGRGVDAEGDERAAVVATLTVQERPVGALIALYEHGYRLGPEDGRVVQEAADLVAAQIELSAVATQEERLVKAELLALRARISPHFIYNSLAAIASYIHSSPEQARELLSEFAEFTRYAFRGERTYVTLADELHYVQKYLRIEQARFGERLGVRVQVAPEVLHVVVPVLSLQPLVENAVRHGVEARAGRRTVEILGIDRDVDVELRVSDDGAGMAGDQISAALRGAGEGTGLHNVDRRLRATFGEEYGLEIESEQGRGTTVIMTVPKFRAGVRAA